MKYSIAFVSAGYLLSACAAQSPIWPPAYDLAGTSWIFEATNLGDEWVTAEPGTEIRISFTERGVEGFAGCNTFFGAYEQTSEGLTIGELGSTRKLCESTVQQQEDTFLDNLRQVYAVEAVEQLVHLPMRGGGDLVLRRYEEPPIIDHGGLHTFDTCVNAGGDLVGADNQCVIDGQVYFADHRPGIDLEVCTAYFDGCNTIMVNDGALGATTLAACPAERDVPACFLDEYRLTDTYGEVMAIDRYRLTLRTDDILEDFEIGREPQVRRQVRNIMIGDYVSLKYGRSDGNPEAKIISITKD